MLPIEEMTMRIKNIIFFKAVLVVIFVSILGYYIKEIQENISINQERLYGAQKILHKTENRLKILGEDSAKLTEITKLYHELSNNPDLICFNEASYRKDISEIEKKFNLDTPIVIYSSSPIYKKKQTLNSVAVKSTSVRLEYFSNDYNSSTFLAQNAFNALPPYNFVTKISIKEVDTLTPDLLKMLDESEQIGGIKVEVDMEVRELELKQ